MAETPAKKTSKATTAKAPAVSVKAAPTKAAAAKPAAAPKPAVKAPVAKTPTPKPAAKKTPVKRAPKAAPAMVVTDEQRYRMVAEAAYYRAESNNFKSDPVRDWIEAEADIAALLSGNGK